MVAALKDFQTFRCRKLHATISIETCLARQRKARDAYKSYSNTYIGEAAYSCLLSCLDCEQGKKIAVNSDIGEFEKPKRLKVVPEKKRVKSATMIDWTEMKNAYNQQCGTNYLTPKTMLQALYKNSSITAVAAKLGVSQGALRRAMIANKIRFKGQPFKKKPVPPKRQPVPVWEKPLCAKCGKYAAVAKGMCKACYEKRRRTIQRLRENRTQMWDSISIITGTYVTIFIASRQLPV